MPLLGGDLSNLIFSSHENAGILVVIQAGLAMNADRVNQANVIYPETGVCPAGFGHEILPVFVALMHSLDANRVPTRRARGSVGNGVKPTHVAAVANKYEGHEQQDNNNEYR